MRTRPGGSRGQRAVGGGLSPPPLALCSPPSALPVRPRKHLDSPVHPVGPVSSDPPLDRTPGMSGTCIVARKRASFRGSLHADYHRRPQAVCLRSWSIFRDACSSWPGCLFLACSSPVSLPAARLQAGSCRLLRRARSPLCGRAGPQSQRACGRWSGDVSTWVGAAENIVPGRAVRNLFITCSRYLLLPCSQRPAQQTGPHCPAPSPNAGRGGEKALDALPVSRHRWNL
jgi:hypothetical protein